MYNLVSLKQRVSVEPRKLSLGPSEGDLFQDVLTCILLSGCVSLVASLGAGSLLSRCDYGYKRSGMLSLVLLTFFLLTFENACSLVSFPLPWLQLLRFLTSFTSRTLDTSSHSLYRRAHMKLSNPSRSDLSLSAKFC